MKFEAGLSTALTSHPKSEVSLSTAAQKGRFSPFLKMPKLYFRHGAMSSSKSLNLVAAVHTYRSQGKKVIVIKPRVDSRFGETNVVSRAGLIAEADLLVDADTALDEAFFDGAHCVFVDEAQFLSTYLVDQLRLLTKRFPVIAYGLRTDFLLNTFPGSQRLLELADNIDEVKTTCQFCNKKGWLVVQRPCFSTDFVDLSRPHAPLSLFPCVHFV